jgi:delta-aminolevulinic acid dehydratase/porphobilinogen synthase
MVMAVNETIKELAPKMPTKYLRDFFAEKDIEAKTFEKNGRDGTFHSIPNEVVVEHMTKVSASEAKALADILRRIDFHNGDVNHFLEHLSGALVEQFEGSV